MGTEFHVACYDCKITRHLGKNLYLVINPPKLEEDVQEYIDDVKEYNGTADLLSFLIDHAGHKCEIYDEHKRENFTEEGDVIINGVVLTGEMDVFYKYWRKK